MEEITSRAIKGEYYRTLGSFMGPAWLSLIANLFMSDQASEEYAWIGMAPAMREWVGGRNAIDLPEFSWTIKNAHYEATVPFKKKDLRRDKTGQVMMRIQELAKRTTTHFAKLVTDLILAGPSTVCYDGSYFFDTTHSEGSSGTQSNDLLLDISDFPVSTGGSITNPSVEDMQWAIIRGILAIVGFKDDVGEPVNEDAQSFGVMVPLTLYPAAQQACNTPVQAGPTQLALKSIPSEFTITPYANVRIGTDWTDSFMVFRADGGSTKPIILQEETKPKLEVLGEGSDHAFKEDEHLYGVDAWRSAGYGDWRGACYITME